MPSGETNICNLALGRLGSSRILDIAENSTEARACALQYPILRDELLRMHRWNFATKRETLTAIVAAPAFGWGKQFALPSDCLRVHQLNGWEENQEPRKWEIEGKYLLTDDTAAQIRYTARVTDPAQFDALFVSALACMLAARIAKDVTGSATMGAEALQEFERILKPNAQIIDSQESRRKRKREWVESDLVKSRQANSLTTGHDWGIFIS